MKPFLENPISGLMRAVWATPGLPQDGSYGVAVGWTDAGYRVVAWRLKDGRLTSASTIMGGVLQNLPLEIAVNACLADIASGKGLVFDDADPKLIAIYLEIPRHTIWADLSFPDT